MKNLSNNYLNELSSDELTGTLGGSFAFDAGRLLRFIGIDAYYGYNNGLGATVAIMDFVLNMQNNNA